MKVWIVSTGCNEDYEIIDVCTSEERAQLVCDWRDADYKEWDTDRINVKKGQMLIFKVRIIFHNRKGESEHLSISQFDMNNPPQYEKGVVCFKDEIPHKARSFNKEGLYVETGEIDHYWSYEVLIESTNRAEARDRGKLLIENYIKENSK